MQAGFLTQYGLPPYSPTASVINPSQNIPNYEEQTGDQWMTVDRKIEMQFNDYFAGNASASKTVYIYDSSGKVLKESGTTDANGEWSTLNSYQSGTTLWVKYVDSNAKFWEKVVVPKMLSSEAVGTTALNRLVFETFQAETFTDALRDAAGTDVTDALEYNITAQAGDTGTWTYTWYGVTDNRAILNSADGDPIYGIDYATHLFVVLSGGNYDSISITGTDGMYRTGSAVVYYKSLPETSFIKWKVGNDYVYQGVGSVSLAIDMTGFTGATNATMQFYIMGYSDPVYAASHAATGATASTYSPDAVQLMETTVEVGV